MSSASGLLMRFFCVDCEGVGVGVFFGVNVDVWLQVILKREG